MQYTDKYKFNLIETSDTFSPEALNANAEAAERELLAVRTEFAAADTANKSTLEASVNSLKSALGTGGSNCRIQTGSYTGKDKYGKSDPNSLSFSFKPYVVFIGLTKLGGNTFDNGYAVMIQNCPYSRGAKSNYPLYVTWSGNGVSWYSEFSAAYQFNTNGTTYYYVAIGV